MLRETLNNFGYPGSLIKDYDNWYLLLRPKQVTLGALALVCKEGKRAFSQISQESFMELQDIAMDIERKLFSLFRFEKINYLMLMMADPVVHFHVIPRYSEAQKFNGLVFYDHGWPSVPDLTKVNMVGEKSLLVLQNSLQSEFSAPNTKKYDIVYTTGAFDPFHYGHLNILQKAKEIAKTLIVGVSTDKLIKEAKGHDALLPFKERMAIIASLKCVDKVIPQEDKNKQRIVDMYNVDAIVVGSDWKGKYPKVSCKMVYFPYTKKINSTLIKKKLVKNFIRTKKPLA